MIFRTKGLKVSSLLTIPFYCFVLTSILHPVTGYCEKKGEKPLTNPQLPEEQKSDDGVKPPPYSPPPYSPPPYSAVAGSSGDTVTESYLDIDDDHYPVLKTGEVLNVSVGWDKGLQYRNISYSNLVPEHYIPGAYIATPIDFFIFDHHLVEQEQHTGTLWLFPNGIGSGTKRGRVLVTLQNLRRRYRSKESPEPQHIRQCARPPCLRTTDTTRSSYRLALTLPHSEASESESFDFPLIRCEQNLVDLGSSRDWGQFKDKYNKHTICLTVTPCCQLRRLDPVTPGHDHSFVFEVPYAALRHEWHEDGTPTVQAEAANGINTGWIDIDGAMIGFALKNKTSNITTYIYSPYDYDDLTGIQDHYISDDAETPLSSIQKQTIEKQALQHSKLRFHSFMDWRKITIYWEAPDGKSHPVGRFGYWRHNMFEASENSSTNPWISSISYKHFFKKLDGQNALFRFEVKTPDPDRAGKYAKSHSDDSGQCPVHPTVPPLVENFQRLKMNSGRKMGTSAEKSE